MRTTYRMREFAEVGGVTVKALRHYERLGLLKPSRTASGYRLYSRRDRERLRQILALKRLGIPLAQMGSLLDADPATLVERLSAVRDALAEQRARLLRADHAIALVEESLVHAPDDDGGLSRLADVTDMQHHTEWMKRYFSDDVWEVARGFYENWPTEEWVTLYRDIASALAADPHSARAKDLVRRWNTLALSLWRNLASGLPESRNLHEGFARAWHDRENWPETLKRRFEDYRMNDVAGFLKSVAET